MANGQARENIDLKIEKTAEYHRIRIQSMPRSSILGIIANVGIFGLLGYLIEEAFLPEGRSVLYLWIVMALLCLMCSIWGFRHQFLTYDILWDQQDLQLRRSGFGSASINTFAWRDITAIKVDSFHPPRTPIGFYLFSITVEARGQLVTFATCLSKREAELIVEHLNHVHRERLRS